MICKLWLYAYTFGATSSRPLGRLVQRDVGVVMLAVDNRPEFRTLARVRQQHRQELAELFKQVLKRCRRQRLLGLEHAAIGSTKLRANASEDSR